MSHLPSARLYRCTVFLYRKWPYPPTTYNELSRLQKFNDAVTYLNEALITKGYNPYYTSKSKFFMEFNPAGKELLGKQNYPDVSFSEIFYMAGLANYESGQIRKAYTYFTNCISQGYNLGESHYMIALCWLGSNQNEKACKSFNESQRQGYALASEQLAKFCN